MPWPGAAERYFHARQHSAGRLPRSHHSRVTPIHSRMLGRRCMPGPRMVRRAKSPGGRLVWSRLKGFGGICARQRCLLEGQTAAHGQITERRYSVARIRFSFGLERLASRPPSFCPPGRHAPGPDLGAAGFDPSAQKTSAQEAIIACSGGFFRNWQPASPHEAPSRRPAEAWLGRWKPRPVHFSSTEGERP
jgi:hypothetical protein